MFCLADFRAMKEVAIKDPPVSFSSNGVVEKVELKIYNVRLATDPRFIERRSNLWRLVSRHTQRFVSAVHVQKPEKPCPTHCRKPSDVPRPGIELGLGRSRTDTKRL